MRGIIATAVAGGMLYLSAASAGYAENLIKNGSFEKPKLDPQGFANICSPACKGQLTFPDWNVVGVIGANIDVVTATHFRGLNFESKVGKQYVDLSISGTLSGIEQAVDTTPDKTYLITFYLGAIYDKSKLFGPVSRIELYINRKLYLSAINLATPSDTTQVWRKCVAVFTAPSDKTLIAFFAGAPPPNAPDGFNSIDGVTLELAPAGTTRGPSCI